MTTRTELVRALAKPGEDVLLSLDAHKCHMLHMAVGLSGEAGELLEAVTEENMLEELGDAFFYLEGLLQGVGSTVAEFTLAWNVRAHARSKDPLRVAAIHAAALLDDVKRYVIYDKPLDLESLQKNAVLLLERLYAAADDFNFSDEDIHADNLRKLGKRYASLTYSDAAAQARADKSCG
jgi:hypothetical protein